MKRAAFEKSAETAKISEYFQSIPFSKDISFAEASERTGLAISSQLGAYQSAKRLVARDHGMIIESIRGVGFRKLQPDEVLKRSPGHFHAIRRRAKRGGTEIEIAISGNLTRIEMLEATENLARFRIISDTAEPAKTNRKIQDKPEPEKLPSIIDVAKNISGD